ncbi:MAG: DUF4091 domain-containing protein [Clostridiaceae bacterium]|nr:DUF4091 domain-containing protein [Clostridiaceae bacterium]
MTKHYFDHPYSKILNDTVLDRQKSSFQIYIAKNEYEGCQLVLKSDRDTEVSVSVKTADFEYEIFLVRYVSVRKEHMYPDGLEPLCEDTRISLKKGIRQPVYICFYADSDVKSGSHKAEVWIMTEEETIKTHIDIYVFSFTLPVTPSCITAFGLGRQYIEKMHGTDEPYAKYYEFLLSHKVSAYDIPVNILDDEADKYLSDMRMTSFRIPCSNDDATIEKYYNKLKKNKVWFSKGFFYPLDEPTCMDHYNKLYEYKDRLNRLFPNNNVCTPFFINPIDSPDKDSVELLDGVSNIWCPKSYMWMNEDVYAFETKPFAEKMLEKKRRGDKVLWYVCWEPGDPYCNLFVDMPGIMHRILFWQKMLYDVDGLLYWHSNYWEHVDNPWDDMATVKWLSDYVFGDGSLLYNGKNGPCGSLRLEAVRDGIEDFEYLKIAEEAIGKEATLKLVNKVTKSLLHYTRDNDEFSDARKELGFLIEKAAIRKD